MSDFLKRGDTLYLYIPTIYDDAEPPAPVTGLTADDFDFKLSKNNGDVDASSVTLQEIATGRYLASYGLTGTSADDGFWGFEANATDYNQGSAESYTVTQYGIPSASLIATIVATAIDASATHGYAQDAAAMAGDYANDRPIYLAALDAAVSSRAVPGDEMNLEDDAIAEAKFGDGAISDRVLAEDVDTYQAKVVLVDDDSGAKDRYVVTWFKNAQPIFAGITVPLIRVKDLAAAGNLFDDVAMDDASDGDYAHDEDTDRIESGKKYIAVATATIDGQARYWKQPIGRDTA